jgi:hypothetical protein
MPIPEGTKWSIDNKIAFALLIVAVLGLPAAYFAIPGFHEWVVSQFTQPAPIIPDTMVGTWEGGLFRDPPRDPAQKPNTKVIYELSTNGVIKFRDDCTYELTDDDTYFIKSRAVVDDKITFDENNPDHKDVSQVRMQLVGGKLHVFVSYDSSGQKYLEGTLDKITGKLSEIPRPSKEQCKNMQ